MPHLPLGSLKDEHHRKPLAEGETVDLLFQGLTVLEHLHSRGVAYRDLKPENILVERRSPLHLRFADFGLASDQPDLKTFCGTELYVAPEILKGGNYTTAVDIWSLGVIVLEYRRGSRVKRTGPGLVPPSCRVRPRLGLGSLNRSSHHRNATNEAAGAVFRCSLFDKSRRPGAPGQAVSKLGRCHTNTDKGHGKCGT